MWGFRVWGLGGGGGGGERRRTRTRMLRIVASIPLPTSKSDRGKNEDTYSENVDNDTKIVTIDHD